MLNFAQQGLHKGTVMFLRSSGIEIAVMAFLFAKGDMYINSGHNKSLLNEQTYTVLVICASFLTEMTEPLVLKSAKAALKDDKR